MRSHSPLQMETKRTDVDGKTLKRTALLELIVQSSLFFSSLFQSMLPQISSKVSPAIDSHLQSSLFLNWAKKSCLINNEVISKRIYLTFFSLSRISKFSVYIRTSQSRSRFPSFHSFCHPRIYPISGLPNTPSRVNLLELNFSAITYHFLDFNKKQAVQQNRLTYFNLLNKNTHLISQPLWRSRSFLLPEEYITFLSSNKPTADTKGTAT